jgi:hypothetical protein
LGRDLAALQRSAHAPTATFTAPFEGAQHRSDVEVAWSGQDADGDALTYLLLLSHDGGATWTPIRTDTTDTHLVLRGAELPHAPDLRLRVVASDGFLTGEAHVSFSLDGAPSVVGVEPPDGARGVSPWTRVTAVLRDPMDPASVSPETVMVYDETGQAALGNLRYDEAARSIEFEPSEPLAGGRLFEVRLTRGLRNTGGRSLDADVTWRFTTRGVRLYLPATHRGLRPGLAPSATPTWRPPATRAATATPPSSATPSGTPTPTVDLAGTAFAATRTAQAATATPDTRTSVVATQTATTPTIVPTAQPSVFVDAISLTGADPQHLRTAFVAGDSATLWFKVANQTAAPVTASVELTVVGDGGFAPPSLNWRGSVEAPAGSSWFRLDRVVPQAPVDVYTFVASVTTGGGSSLSMRFYLAASLAYVDDFSNPGSGWPSDDTATARSGYSGGEYEILVRAADWWYRVSPGVSMGDQVFEADALIDPGGLGAAGLVIGLSPDDSEFTVFAVDGGGQYGVFRRQDTAWSTLVGWTADGAVRPAGTSNHLMLLRQGGSLHIFSNGSHLAQIDAANPDGRIGLYAEATVPSVRARFDNVRLYRVR